MTQIRSKNTASQLVGIWKQDIIK